MTTITNLAPGFTLISPKGKDREEMIASLTVQMASAIVRSGLPLDNEDAITMNLCDAGFPSVWIANLLKPSIDQAREALAVAEKNGLEIPDRKVLQ